MSWITGCPWVLQLPLRTTKHHRGLTFYPLSIHLSVSSPHTLSLRICLITRIHSHLILTRYMKSKSTFATSHVTTPLRWNLLPMHLNHVQFRAHSPRRHTQYPPTQPNLSTPTRPSPTTPLTKHTFPSQRIRLTSSSPLSHQSQSPIYASIFAHAPSSTRPGEPFHSASLHERRDEGR